jgi:hypothetical protein
MLGTRAGWIEALLAKVVPLGLVAQHRPTYQSWTYSGRSVLQVSRTSGNALAVRAGINYGTAGPGKPAPVKIILTGPVTGAHLSTLLDAVAAAVGARQAGSDNDDREHQLQAALAAHDLPGMKVRHFHREFPAWRSRRRPGFIDFLAATPSGDLDVIETKIGGDCTVALQALEYWIWACANTTIIRSRGGWPTQPAGNRHRMTLLLAQDAKGRAYDRYLYGVLEAIAGDVPWRVLLAKLQPPTSPAVAGHPLTAPGSGPANHPPSITTLATHQNPQPLLADTRGEPPCAPPRWSAYTTAMLPGSIPPIAPATTR